MACWVGMPGYGQGEVRGGHVQPLGCTSVRPVPNPPTTKHVSKVEHPRRRQLAASPCCAAPTAQGPQQQPAPRAAPPQRAEGWGCSHHAEQARAGVPADEVFILEPRAVDGDAPGAVALQEVSALWSREEGSGGREVGRDVPQQAAARHEQLEPVQQCAKPASVVNLRSPAAAPAAAAAPRHKPSAVAAPAERGCCSGPAIMQRNTPLACSMNPLMIRWNVLSLYPVGCRLRLRCIRRQGRPRGFQKGAGGRGDSETPGFRSRRTPQRHRPKPSSAAPARPARSSPRPRPQHPAPPRPARRSPRGTHRNSPVHIWRKFSAVLGTMSLNSSILMRPACTPPIDTSAGGRAGHMMPRGGGSRCAACTHACQPRSSPVASSLREHE